MTDPHIYRLSRQATAFASAADRSLETTTLALAVQYGSRNDPQGQGGIAHLLEHLLMTGPVAGGYSLTESIERLGGQSNALTAVDGMVFHARVLNADAPAVARLLCTALLDPQMDHALLESERRVVRQELTAAQDDPADLVQDAFLAQLYPGHPLGRPVGGVPAELDRLTIDDVREAHAQSFVRRRLALISVGGLAPEALLEVASDVLVTPHAAQPLTDEPVSPGPLTPGSDEDLDWSGDGFSWLCAGGRAPALDSPDRYAYQVLSCLMGSSPSSLLFRRLRNDAGLAYAFQSWSRSYLEGGAWRVLVGGESRNGPALVEIIRELLRQLSTDGPGEQDLEVARRQAVMDGLIDRESPADHAIQLASRTRAGSLDWSMDQEQRALRAVDAQDVAKAAARMLEQFTVVVRSRGGAA
ncbi:M16 family metallopeptidase [Streptomyces sp. NPDC060031]|uniref:M16 family metallopeptidase n=1 Tax=Streptomyces sp. NPDC060031 TaxID=3347043 RepID=UPI0036C9E177